MLPYLAALLGLGVSTFALYAHVLISLASRIVVDMVAPRGENAAYQPRFGPVDALERNEDYEGALQEYLVLARIYPRNYEVLSRTGRVQEILGDNEEAVAWYLRARKRASRAEEALAAVNRLCVLYDTHLGQSEEADRQLALFIKDYPDALDRDIVVERLERRAHRDGVTLSTFLESLEENPLDIESEVALAYSAPPPIAKSAVELVTLESAGAVETISRSAPEAVKRPSGIGLERLDRASAPPPGTTATNGTSGPGKSPAATKKSTLEALDTLPPSGPRPAERPAHDSKPRIALDSMDS
jgi:tetratricopeptide (TPR) repeat protein